MKIYTYYQDINHSSQKELIDLWKLSWSNHGYEPIVLNLDDAKNHSYFETFNSEMRKIFKEITNREINDYGMSCWFRWLAYATQADEKFYVSDYDAINVNFPITEPIDKLNLLDFPAPFLASGTPIQFENLCKAFVETSNRRIKILKEKTNHYHDQEFFLFNFDKRHNDNFMDLLNANDLKISKDWTKFGGPDINANSLVYHVSHNMTNVTLETTEYYKSFKKTYKERARAMLIRDLLKIK